MKSYKMLSVAALIGITGLATATIWNSPFSYKTKQIKSIPNQEAYTPSSAPGSTIQATDKVQVEGQRIQLALILDTSNSMDGLIDQAKAQLWNVVNGLAKAKTDTVSADITIALYEYGNDGLSVTTGYIRKVVGFTNDLDDISEKLFTLKTNGGSEYCGKVLMTSLDELDWSESDSSLKVIYIAGNEEFTQGPVSYKSACTKAKANNVIINTIFCGPYQTGINTAWQDGAVCSGGDYLNIDSDKKTIQVATPYDQQILQLNTQLNNTYVYYGSQGASSKEKQVKQDQNAGNYSMANTAKRAVSKSSKMYYNGNWDLVDAYSKDKNVVKTVDKNTLPDSLKTKNEIELESLVKQKTIERESVKKEIAVLAVKREEYVNNVNATDTTGNENTLGASMLKSIKSQAIQKGFVFEE